MPLCTCPIVYLGDHSLPSRDHSANPHALDVETTTATCLNSSLSGRWSKTDYFKRLLEILSAAERVLNDYSLSEAHRKQGNVIFRISS